MCCVLTLQLSIKKVFKTVVNNTIHFLWHNSGLEDTDEKRNEFILEKFL